MGGPGSTRWGLHSKATPVEDCLTLDITGLVARACRNGWSSGTSAWSRQERTHSEIGWNLDQWVEGSPVLLILRYHFHDGEEMRLSVPLVEAFVPMKGKRFLGLCPLGDCDRKVANLYLPPGARRFGCRIGYRLTYESSQTSDNRYNWVRRQYRFGTRRWHQRP